MDNLEQTKKINWFKIFITIDRIAAIILFVVILIYGITGYGMTKGLISPETARTLHLGWLGGIGLVALVLHTFFAFRLMFKRYNFWNIFSKTILVLFYIFLISFFCWVHFFYNNTKSYSAQTATTSATISSTVFTAETLSAYDGLNGQPAYVAVDGVVYDLSRLFRNGNHQGHSAGKDLSSAFHQEHPNNFLNGYSIVGSYK